MVDDAIGQMARSLKNIERLLAKQEFGDSDEQVEGMGGRRPLDPASYGVRETDDLDGVDEGGTVTLQPGETKTLVDARSRSGSLAILSVGATDQTNVSYQLVIDDKKVVGGTTNAPLGLLNDEFSFVDQFGGYIAAQRYAEYRATLDASASSSVELAARMHVQHGGN